MSKKKKNKTQQPKPKERKPLEKQTQLEILQSTLVHQITGQKRTHRFRDTDRPYKIPKHISPSVPIWPKEEPLNHNVLGELLKHFSTRILEARIAAAIPNATPAKSISNLFNYLFLSTPLAYDTICFCANSSEDDNICFRHILNDEEWVCTGTSHSPATIHLAIFTYILKRISCLPMIEAEKYIINNHGASATDDAFIHFLKALLLGAGYGDQSNVIVNTDTAAVTTPAPPASTPLISPASPMASPPKQPSLLHVTNSQRKSLTISDPRAIRAYSIFTQHPMKFKVQIKVGQQLKPEERCVVWCTDAAGGWDMQWEYMGKWLELGLVPESNYRF